MKNPTSAKSSAYLACSPRAYVAWSFLNTLDWLKDMLRPIFSAGVQPLRQGSMSTLPVMRVKTKLT